MTNGAIQDTAHIRACLRHSLLVQSIPIVKQLSTMVVMILEIMSFALKLQNFMMDLIIAFTPKVNNVLNKSTSSGYNEAEYAIIFSSIILITTGCSTNEDCVGATDTCTNGKCTCGTNDVCMTSGGDCLWYGNDCKKCSLGQCIGK